MLPTLTPDRSAVKKKFRHHSFRKYSHANNNLSVDTRIRFKILCKPIRKTKMNLYVCLHTMLAHCSGIYERCIRCISKYLAILDTLMDEFLPCLL